MRLGNRTYRAWGKLELPNYSKAYNYLYTTDSEVRKPRQRVGRYQILRCLHIFGLYYNSVISERAINRATTNQPVCSREPFIVRRLPKYLVNLHKVCATIYGFDP